MVTVTPIPSQPSQGWADTDWTLHTGSGHNTSIRENGVSMWTLANTVTNTLVLATLCYVSTRAMQPVTPQLVVSVWLCWVPLGYCRYIPPSIVTITHFYTTTTTIISLSLSLHLMYFIFPIHSLTSDQPGKQPKISRN